mmetsp:Transcript_5335/g.8260  ORF Transcript_5335/g.8260 Transcript_5335/m.8260 type:complete len:205 (-) Transcript_5335:254-868(-)|eukprot:CAMPEP_0184662228 /NCGR_PEP_ID=MMETSP0308-20130426/42169_1 /TAXON_ID=38269 /ORGANISM="Gloeochaete witrockiana, Strain SAG 46.84" /LENGTH=204 /DNA_ID=CAMNT_0027104083 /DNA_START=77 /DNA_END=691 /DNA_ORIENTATION=-
MYTSEFSRMGDRLEDAVDNNFTEEDGISHEFVQGIPVQESNPLKTIQCPLEQCGKTFAFKRGFIEHLKRKALSPHHLSLNSNLVRSVSDSKYTCSTCSKTLLSKHRTRHDLTCQKENVAPPNSDSKPLPIPPSTLPDEVEKSFESQLEAQHFIDDFLMSKPMVKLTGTKERSDCFAEYWGCAFIGKDRSKAEEDSTRKLKKKAG